MKLSKQQKWFLVFDGWLFIFLLWGFRDTFITHKWGWGWFAFSCFIFIIFNIVEFPRE
jgi:hypothetical protein